jgi:4-amino-4-deoxy-L-arabinose transferase-like glycosyltransferase
VTKKAIPRSQPATTKTIATEPANSSFKLPYPLLWLALAVVVVYFPTFSFQLTELDDSIFIREFRGFNEDIGNMVTAFGRGLFDAVKDPYYRPIFLDAMILNYKLSNGGENIASYHVINVLLHLTAVLLLYKLFIKLGIRELPAFLLTLIFAVHPVLSQAVSWIPGRNDTILAIFVFSFLLQCINYVREGRTGALILSVLFLLLAFFTKETAVFAAPVAFVLLLLVIKEPWRSKRSITLYASWIACFVIWYACRAAATVNTGGVSAGQVVGDFFMRLPLIVQYLGKIFLPFNLSVFPIQQDTVYYFGIAAVFILALGIALSKQRDLRITIAGFATFLLFLLPALIVPQKLNEQAFEHRLYLPIVGILLLLSQTSFLKNKLGDKQLVLAFGIVCCVLAGLNFRHQQNFKDPYTFWSQAAETSPHSAYASMMLGARIPDDQQRSATLFHKAYALNPSEKYINFYMAEMLQRKDSVLASEPYLLREKQVSDYYLCDFYLARVAMEKKDLPAAIAYLKAYQKRDPHDSKAYNNLILLYLNTNQPDSARAQVRTMQQNGIEVSPALLRQVGL